MQEPNSMQPPIELEANPTASDGFLPSHRTSERGPDVDDENTSWLSFAHDNQITIESNASKVREKTKTKHRSRRAFSSQRRKETAETRARGACGICRIRKVRVRTLNRPINCKRLNMS